MAAEPSTNDEKLEMDVDKIRINHPKGTSAHPK